MRCLLEHPTSALRSFTRQVCYSVGELALRARLFRMAIPLLCLAVSAPRKGDTARQQLASALWQSGCHNEAVRLYREAAGADPSDQNFQYHLAYVLRNAGDYEAAVLVLQNALAIESLGQLHTELAKCYRALGRVDEADRALERALRHAPHDLDALAEKVRLAGYRRQWRDVLDIGLELMSNRPSAEIAYLTAVGLARANRLTEAEKVLEKGLQLEPDNVDLMAELAVVLADQGQFAAANAQIAYAMSKHGDDYHLKVAASHISLAGGDHQGSLQSAREAVRMQPDAPEAHFALGYACLESGQASAALEAFETVLVLAPELRDAQAGKGAALSLLGRYLESTRDVW